MIKVGFRFSIVALLSIFLAAQSSASASGMRMSKNSLTVDDVIREAELRCVPITSVDSQPTGWTLETTNERDLRSLVERLGVPGIAVRPSPSALIVQRWPADKTPATLPSFAVAARVTRKGKTLTLTAPASVQRRLNSSGGNIFFLYQRQTGGWEEIGFASKPARGCKPAWLSRGAESSYAYNSSVPVFPGDKTPWKEIIEIPNLPSGEYAIATNIEVLKAPTSRAGGFFRI